MALYVMLGMCAVAGALLVWRYDLYEREPWYMLVLMGAVGFGVMWLMGFIEPISLAFFGKAPRPAPAIALVAATHEEMGRLLAVVALAWFVPRQFNDPMDGLVYGSVVGLGMALDESFFFVDLYGVEGAIPPRSEYIRFAGHLIMGGITCFGVGAARFGKPRWPLILVSCVLISMAIHFTWDWLAFVTIRAGGMSAIQNIAAIALMGFGMLVYGTLVTIGSEWSRQAFAPDTNRSLWGWPFNRMIGSRDRPPSAS